MAKHLIATSSERALARKKTRPAQEKFASAQHRRAETRARELLSFDEALRQHPGQALAGVDEVGMGTLAGPVVAAAVILPAGSLFLGVDDSKKVSAKRRVALAEMLKQEATIGVGIASVEEIDELGIARAGRLAMRRAVDPILADADCVIVDARTLEDLPLPQRAIVGADRQSLCVAAASIVAKVARDNMMVALEVAFPGYGFLQHKGYGTKAHLEALRTLGATSCHRRYFGPVARALRAASRASARSDARTSAR